VPTANGVEELSTDFREPELPPAEDIPVDGGEVWWNTSFFQKGFELNDWWILGFYSSAINSLMGEEPCLVMEWKVWDLS